MRLAPRSICHLAAGAPNCEWNVTLKKKKTSDSGESHIKTARTLAAEDIK